MSILERMQNLSIFLASEAKPKWDPEIPQIFCKCKEFEHQVSLKKNEQTPNTCYMSSTINALLNNSRVRQLIDREL